MAPLSEPVAYYNEKDKFAAAWLRSLIDAGLIAYGNAINVENATDFVVAVREAVEW